MRDMEINRIGNWRLWWGPAPVLQGATVLGTITLDECITGALLLLASGVYVMGNAGALRTLPQSPLQAVRP